LLKPFCDFPPQCSDPYDYFAAGFPGFHYLVRFADFLEAKHADWFGFVAASGNIGG
jgi:hypothetical protein